MTPVRAPEEGALVTRLGDGLHVIRGTRLSAHVYVLQGRDFVAVVDTGSSERVGVLEDGLRQLGLGPGDVGLVLNTHEHFDHVGGNPIFPTGTLVAAHASAARKILEGDRYVTMLQDGATPRAVNLLLRDGSEVHLGGVTLKVLHAPGHTSGSTCFFEPARGWLFSGDTLFAGGILSYIAESGSVGDYLATLGHLATLRLARIFPGHGRPSDDPEGDIARAAAAARDLLAGREIAVRRRGDECGG